MWAAQRHIRGHEEWQFKEETRNKVRDEKLGDLPGTSLRREEQGAVSWWKESYFHQI